MPLETLEGKKQKQYKDLIDILKRIDNLDGVDIQQLLTELSNTNDSKNEFVSSLKRLYSRFGEDFFTALKEAGINNPLNESKILPVKEENIEDDIQGFPEKIKEMSQKSRIIEAPLGYEVYTIREFIATENKTVAFWSQIGATGSGEILTNEKLNEFFLKPKKGDSILLTQGNKSRVAPGIENFYFKVTKKVF